MGRFCLLTLLLGLLHFGFAEKCPRQRTSPGKEILCYTPSYDIERLKDVICSCTILVHQGHDLQNLSTSEFNNLRKSLKEKKADLRFVLSVNDDRSSLKTSGTVRQKAAARLERLLTEVDGVELNVTAGSKERLVHFVKGLKDEMIRKSNEKAIFLALPTKPEQLAKQFDLKELSKYVDFFTISTHYLVDEEEAFHTFHPSRLMGLFDMLNTDSVVDLIIGMGAPKPKILMSVPASAYKFVLKNQNENTPRSPTKNEEPVALDRKEVCDLMSDGEWTLERDDDLTAPYAFKNENWIAFEDKTSIGIKGKYVTLRGLAGLGIRNIENDLENSCGKSITQEVFHSFSSIKRKTRQAVLSSLENELHSSQISYPNHVKSSGYRIVRVVDTLGQIHAMRENSHTEFSCTRQGYFVHPRSCNRFYRCVKFNQEIDDYSVFEFDCPAGLAFDERTEVCVWPGSISKGSPCPGSSEIAPVPKNRFQCPEHPGYYADPQNCRWFFACFDLGGPHMIPYEFRCPFGLVFDEDKLICEWPWLVPKCGGGGYTQTEYGGHPGGDGHYGGHGGYGGDGGYGGFGQDGGYGGHDGGGGYGEHGEYEGNGGHGDDGKYGEHGGYGGNGGYGGSGHGGGGYGGHDDGSGSHDTRPVSADGDYGKKESGYSGKNSGHGGRDGKDDGYGGHDTSPVPGSGGYGKKDGGYGGYGGKGSGHGGRDGKDDGYGGHDTSPVPGGGGYGKKDGGYGGKDSGREGHRGRGGKDDGYGGRDTSPVPGGGGYGKKDGEYGGKDSGHGGHEDHGAKDDGYGGHDTSPVPGDGGHGGKNDGHGGHGGNDDEPGSNGEKDYGHGRHDGKDDEHGGHGGKDDGYGGRDTSPVPGGGGYGKKDGEYGGKDSGHGGHEDHGAKDDGYGGHDTSPVPGDGGHGGKNDGHGGHGGNDDEPGSNGEKDYGHGRHDGKDDEHGGHGGKDDGYGGHETSPIPGGGGHGGSDDGHGSQGGEEDGHGGHGENDGHGGHGGKDDEYGGHDTSPIPGGGSHGGSDDGHESQDGKDDEHGGHGGKEDSHGGHGEDGGHGGHGGKDDGYGGHDTSPIPGSGSHGGSDDGHGSQGGKDDEHRGHAGKEDSHGGHGGKDDGYGGHDTSPIPGGGSHVGSDDGHGSQSGKDDEHGGNDGHGGHGEKDDDHAGHGGNGGHDGKDDGPVSHGGDDRHGGKDDGHGDHGGKSNGHDGKNAGHGNHGGKDAVHEFGSDEHVTGIGGSGDSSEYGDYTNVGNYDYITGSDGGGKTTSSITEGRITSGKPNSGYSVGFTTSGGKQTTGSYRGSVTQQVGHTGSGYYSEGYTPNAGYTGKTKDPGSVSSVVATGSTASGSGFSANVGYTGMIKGYTRPASTGFTSEGISTGSGYSSNADYTSNVGYTMTGGAGFSTGQSQIGISHTTTTSHFGSPTVQLQGSKPVDGFVTTSDLSSGSIYTEGNTGRIVTSDITQPGYVNTNAGTAGFGYTSGIKTIYTDNSGIVVRGGTSSGVSLAGQPYPDVVIGGQTTPGVYLTGQTSPGAAVGGSLQPEIATVNRVTVSPPITTYRGPNIFNGNRGTVGPPITTYHGSTGSKTSTNSLYGSKTTSGYKVTEDTGYKTNEYHDNGGRGTIRYNNGYVTSKFTESDLQDIRPSYAPLPSSIVSGGRIEGAEGTEFSTNLARGQGYTQQSSTNGIYTQEGFTKTGPTKTGITTAQLGGSGSYVIGTSPRPRPNLDHIGEKAFEGNVGYKSSSSVAPNTGYITSTPAIDFGQLDNSKITLSSEGTSGQINSYSQTSGKQTVGSAGSTAKSISSVNQGFTTPIPILSVEIHNEKQGVTPSINVGPVTFGTYSNVKSTGVGSQSISSGQYQEVGFQTTTSGQYQGTGSQFTGAGQYQETGSQSAGSGQYQGPSFQPTGSQITDSNQYQSTGFQSTGSQITGSDQYPGTGFQSSDSGKYQGTGSQSTSSGQYQGIGSQSTTSGQYQGEGSGQYQGVGSKSTASQITESNQYQGTGYQTTGSGRYQGTGSPSTSSAQYQGVGYQSTGAGQYQGTDSQSTNAGQYQGIGSQSVGSNQNQGTGYQSTSSDQYQGIGYQSTGSQFTGSSQNKGTGYQSTNLDQHQGIGSQSTGAGQYQGIGSHSTSSGKYQGIGSPSTGSQFTDSSQNLGTGYQSTSSGQYEGIGFQSTGAGQYQGTNSQSTSSGQYQGIGSQSTDSSEYQRPDFQSTVYKSTGYKQSTDFQSPIVSPTKTPIGFTTGPQETYKTTNFGTDEISSVSTVRPLIDTSYKTVVLPTKIPVIVTSQEYSNQDNNYQTETVSTNKPSSLLIKIDFQQPEVTNTGAEYVTSGFSQITNPDDKGIFGQRITSRPSVAVSQSSKADQGQIYRGSSVTSSTTNSGYSYTKEGSTQNSVSSSSKEYDQGSVTVPQTVYIPSTTISPEVGVTFRKPITTPELSYNEPTRRPSSKAELVTKTTGYTYPKPVKQSSTTPQTLSYSTSDQGYPTVGKPLAGSQAITTAFGGSSEFDFSSQQTKQVTEDQGRGSAKYTPDNAYIDEMKTKYLGTSRPFLSAEVEGTQSESGSPTGVYGRPYTTAMTPSITTYNGNYRKTYPTIEGYKSTKEKSSSTEIGRSKGRKIIVKLTDLHPLLIGKLGAECTCKADPFDIFRDPDRKHIPIASSSGIVDLANYDESDIYVDIEAIKALEKLKAEKIVVSIEADKEAVRIEGGKSERIKATTSVPCLTTEKQSEKYTGPIIAVYDDSIGKPSSAYLPSSTESPSSTYRLSSSTASRRPIVRAQIGGPSSIVVSADNNFGSASITSSRTANGRSGKSLFSSDSLTSNARGKKRFEIEKHHVAALNGGDGDDECARPGLFRHPKLCNKFYVCHWDEWKKKFSRHVFNCPIHLTFDSGAGACNWPSKGPACQDDNLLV